MKETICAVLLGFIIGLAVGAVVPNKPVITDLEKAIATVHNTPVLQYIVYKDRVLLVWADKDMPLTTGSLYNFDSHSFLFANGEWHLVYEN